MAKAIMIQGTMSDAGKSLLCAGLCRVFHQDGRKVAPFKSQNMALNSFITRDGLEMGRAQAVQAEAAGLEPDVRMNPVLLKPVTDRGSQVIVNGEVRGNFKAADYYAMKHTLVSEIMAAYESLADEFDIIVLEGAGSPAEINLKSGDFVNMGMAKLARAPVLLVGDIDRGGVFAQLWGTIALLEDREQDIIKATVVNKFRGDLELFEDGLAMLRELTGKPVAGVLPYLKIDIEEEDSLAERLVRREETPGLEIAVIRLPRISNFTDFAPLEATPGVRVRYITRTEELREPDLVILPGTKNTMADLDWLRQNGLEERIRRMAADGVPILGICGGYQMLGTRITDADGVEGTGSMTGLGLLPVATEFTASKHRTRVCGQFQTVGGIFSDLTGRPVTGYEIHMGRCDLAPEAMPLIRLEEGITDGCQRGNVYGTYLHGFFDAAPCREAILNALSRRRGISAEAVSFDWHAYKERQYDLLADAIREHLDMALIYRILEEGI